MVWLGSGRGAVVWLGSGRSGVVRDWAGWCGVVWLGSGRAGVVREWVAWCGVVWLRSGGAVWCWCGKSVGPSLTLTWLTCVTVYLLCFPAAARLMSFTWSAAERVLCREPHLSFLPLFSVGFG